MGRSLTNSFSLSYAVERTELDSSLLGTVGPNAVKFRQMEPNAITAFSTSLTTTVRNPISKDRQNRKGAVTDLDSTVEFEADTTVSQLTDFIEGVMFSKFTGIFSAQTSYQTTALSSTVAGSVGRYSALTGVTAPSTFDVAGLTGVGEPANRFVQAGSILYSRSHVNGANNGFKVVASVTSSTIVVNETDLVTEALTTDSPAMLEVCGFRFSIGDLTIAGTGPQYTITSAADVTDWGTDLGLVPGQWLWIGGEIGGGHEFDTEINRGWARVRAISAEVLTIDKTLNSLSAGSNTLEPVDIYFGRFCRNVGVDDTDVGVSEALERTFQLRARYDNLSEAVAGDPEFEYSRGNFVNQMTVNLPLTEKSTVNFSMIGIDTAFCENQPTLQGTDVLDPNRTAAFNTTSDLARLRINDLDENGLTTDFKSMTLTINNNVSPEKVLGTLGARYVNSGQFDVSVETQALFTDKAISDAVRNYTTLSMDFSLANSDGAIYVDIPSLTLGNGGRDFPNDESILINLTGNAFGDASLFNTTVSFTVFPFVPSDARASTSSC